MASPGEAVVFFDRVSAALNNAPLPRRYRTIDNFRVAMATEVSRAEAQQPALWRAVLTSLTHAHGGAR